MNIQPLHKRTDTVTRTIHAPAQNIYEAYLDPKAVCQWRPPEGMTCKIYEFNPREGGSYLMAFVYKDETMHGKSSKNEDMIKGRFLELTPAKTIVEMVTFMSDDPAFAGEMKITTRLLEIPDGTEITIIAEDVPEGISAEDHHEGMTSSLQNLAAYTE